MVNSKNKETPSPPGFDPDPFGPVGAVFNRTGLECLINFKIYYNSKIYYSTSGDTLYVQASFSPLFGWDL